MQQTKCHQGPAFCGRPRDEVAVLECPAPFILPSQPLFPACPDFDRGLFVTSAMTDGPDVVRRGGESCLGSGTGRTWRTGVNPVRTFARARRTRGVVAPSLCGTLSAVNVWGGILSHSSKSSGALRFLPMEDEVDVDIVKADCKGCGWLWCDCCCDGIKAGSVGVCLASGVRGLKTG